MSPSRVNLTWLSTLGSYTSKSSGNLISGLEINFRLPVPDITSLIVIASLVFSSLLLIEEDILNSPTPPEKSAGLPVGSGLTFIAILGVEIFFLISMTLLPPLKKASKGSSDCTGFPIVIWNCAGSIYSFPDCCGKRTNWR